MSKLLLALAFFLCLIIQSEAQVSKIFGKKTYQHASVGICVLDMNSSRKIVDLNAQLCIEPASIAKLVTTAVALETFGPDYRFETKIEYTGKIENGVLNGDIWIRGGGDPSLGSRQTGLQQDVFINQWVEAVKAAGIQEVNGSVYSDVSLFDDEPVSPYWLWEDMGNYYAPGIYGLAVFDNSFQLELKSGAAGSKPEIVSIKPDLPELTIDNNLTAVNNDLDSAFLYGAPYQWDRRLFGTIPANRSSFVIKGDMPDPPAFLAVYFRNELQKKGVLVNGKAVSTRLLKDFTQKSSIHAHLVCTTSSIPLSKIIRIIHEKSDNLYTEYLLRHLALTVSNKPASVRNGIQVVRDFWKKKGLDVSALYLSDACGLSPNDRIAPEFLAKLLQYMSQKSKYASVFKSSLPLAGREGSVASFLRGTSLEGKLRMKSGSVQAVTTYAGYYEQSGKSYVVVLMVNFADANRFQIRKDMEYFLLSL